VSDLVIVAICSALPGVVASVMSVANNLIATRNSKHLEKTKNDIERLEKNTNSIKDALVKVTGESEFQKGLKQGQEGVRIGAAAAVVKKDS
jgi:ferritin-like metal-binding protein YciE